MFSHPLKLFFRTEYQAVAKHTPTDRRAVTPKADPPKRPKSPKPRPAALPSRSIAAALI